MTTGASYTASPSRYGAMEYRRAGRTGLKLPAISLGLFQNFGADRDYDSAMEIVGAAFDAGVTHFDLANNYGPPPGSSETIFGELLSRDLRPYRDEIIVSSKAGFEMWPGPYGNWGSRKYLMASIDQTLRRLKTDYVDVFYSHRVDPDTPLEETMGALTDIVRQGKALYVGISSYGCERTRRAADLLGQSGVPLRLHQPSYSIVNRWIEEDGTLDACAELGVGIIAYAVLGHGLLTGKHLAQPARGEQRRTLPSHHGEARTMEAVAKLKAVADARGQSMSQMAISWVLRRPEVTSALVGVRNLAQLQDNLKALEAAPFTADELRQIDAAIAGGAVDRRPQS